MLNLSISRLSGLGSAFQILCFDFFEVRPHVPVGLFFMVTCCLNSGLGGDEDGFRFRSCRFRGGSHDVEAFEVVGQADQIPFQSHFGVTSALSGFRNRLVVKPR